MFHNKMMEEKPKFSKGRIRLAQILKVLDQGMSWLATFWSGAYYCSISHGHGARSRKRPKAAPSRGYIQG